MLLACSHFELLFKYINIQHALQPCVCWSTIQFWIPTRVATLRVFFHLREEKKPHSSTVEFLATRPCFHSDDRFSIHFSRVWHFGVDTGLETGIETILVSRDFYFYLPESEADCSDYFHWDHNFSIPPASKADWHPVLVPLLEIFVQKPIHKLRSNINKPTHKLRNNIKKPIRKLEFAQMANWD